MRAKSKLPNLLVGGVFIGVAAYAMSKPFLEKASKVNLPEQVARTSDVVEEPVANVNGTPLIEHIASAESVTQNKIVVADSPASSPPDGLSSEALPVSENLDTAENPEAASAPSANPYSPEKLQEYVAGNLVDRTEEGFQRYKAEKAQKYLAAVKQLGSAPAPAAPVPGSAEDIRDFANNPYRQLHAALVQSSDSDPELYAQYVDQRRVEGLMGYLSAVQQIGSGR